MLNFIHRVFVSVKRRFTHLIILLNARKTSKNALLNRSVNNILVVCYGNIYRSPLVEYLFKKKCINVNYNVRSVGFYFKQNRPCEFGYIEILKERNYDLTEHKSKLITEKDISWADIIIIMDRYNYDNLTKMKHECIDKVVWIGAFSNLKSVEVKDPYGKNISVVKEVIRELEICVSDICSSLTS